MSMERCRREAWGVSYMAASYKRSKVTDTIYLFLHEHVMVLGHHSGERIACLRHNLRSLYWRV